MFGRARKIALGLTVAASAAFLSQAQAADQPVSAYSAATAFGGTELLYLVQGGADRKGTPAQMATYIYGLASGDCTISSGGAIVCSKTNGVAFGALATVTPATGVATFLTTPSSANLLAALTTKTGTGNAVFGTAPTIAGGAISALTGLGIRSTGASFDVRFAATEVLTADRVLTWVLGDANRTISLAGNVTLGGSLTFSGAFGFTGTLTGATSVTFPTAGTLATLAGSETLTNKTFVCASQTSCVVRIASDVSGLGTGVGTALGVNIGSAGAPVLFNGAGGTPSSMVGTNITGTAAGLTAGNVTTNANLTGEVTSSGNATTLSNAAVIAKLLTGFTSGAGTVSSSDSLLTAIQKINGNDALKAPLASPALTGVPTAPTAAGGTNTTQIATTAFVLANGGGVTFANPSGTAGPTANNGSATTAMRSDATPAIQTATTGQKGLVQPDGTSILISGGVISTAPISAVPEVRTGANTPIVDADRGKVIYLNNASAQIPTLPNPSTLTNSIGWFVSLCNVGAGVQTLTPTLSTIGGQSTLPFPAGSDAAPKCASAESDGTNYRINPVTAPLNGVNVWTAAQTFGTVFGTVTTQTGTTYTFASSDCGTLVRFSNASAVTATIPQGLTIGCNIAVMQASTGQVSVNGSAVTPATLQSAHSYTKTFGAGAIIGLSIDASNHATLTGDGA